MQCLYCGATLGLLSRGEYCSKKHRDLWREQQAELSIERLKQAFAYDQPAAKSRSGSGAVSLLDRSSRDVTPPPELFLHREERKAINPPATPPVTPAVTPPVNPPFTPEVTPLFGPADRRKKPRDAGVFYQGPVTERPAPPNSGFISISDLKKPLHLPVFSRRPSLSEKGTQDQFQADFAGRVVRTVEARYQGMRFPLARSIAPLKGCRSVLAGHSPLRSTLEFLGRPSPLHVELRSLRPVTCRHPALKGLSCTPPPEMPQAKMHGAQQPSYEVRPLVLPRGQTLPVGLSAPVSTTIFPGLPRLAPSRPQPAAWRGALAIGMARLDSTLSNCNFQELRAVESLPEAPSIAPTAAAASQNSFAGRITQAPTRQLDFQDCELADLVIDTVSVEPDPRRTVPAVPIAVEQVHGLPLLALKNRDLEAESMGAPYPETLPASLPHSAATQPAESSPVPQAFLLPLTRIHPAPALCTFAPLVPEQIASAEGNSAVRRHQKAPEQLPLPQLHPRPAEPRGCPILVPVDGPAPFVEKSKSAIQSATKPAFEIAAAALALRDSIQPAASFKSYPEIRPASLPYHANSEPQPHFRALAVRGTANLIGRGSSSLFDRRFQVLAIAQSAAVRTAPATSLSIAVGRQKSRWKMMNVRPTQLEFQAVSVSGARSTVVIGQENRQLKPCLSERVSALQPAALYQRPVERHAVAAAHSQITLAKVLHRTSTRPDSAVTTKKSQPLSPRSAGFTLAPPNCSFQLPAKMPSTPAELGTSTQLCTALGDLRQARPVRIERRSSEFPGFQIFGAVYPTQAIARGSEKSRTKVDTALHAMRIAPPRRTPPPHRVFLQSPKITPVLTRENPLSLPSAAPMRTPRSFGINAARLATWMPEGRFHAVKTGFVEAPAHSRAATHLGSKAPAIHININARSLHLQATVSQYFADFAELAPESRIPEYGPNSGRNTPDLSRRALSWISQGTERRQFAAPLIRSEEKMAPAGFRSAAPADWVRPDATLSLSLPARKSAAIAYGGTASSSPTAAKRELRWVAHKVPWVPMP